MDKIKELTDFYMWMQENQYDHTIRIRVEKKALMYINSIDIKQKLLVRNTNKRLLFAAYLQGKRDKIYGATKWEDYEPIGKYRVMKCFLIWYSKVCQHCSNQQFNNNYKQNKK